MGLKFKEITSRKEVSLKELQGKILAVDSMNLLYQFLTTIRAVDGSVLTNSRGKATSHLIGLFNRTASLMEAGIKLVFVFDGKPPLLKQKTWEKRSIAKQEASQKLEKARESGDVGEMRKYASRTAVLSKEMVEDAKKLITALGLPLVQAPSEGEAQTAYMVRNGSAYASVSQDYDNLIFGCSLLLRNLSIAGKRKKIGKVGYQTVKPELIRLQDVLSELQLDFEQLIMLAILIGTDYNPGGIPGIGFKKALKLVKQYGREAFIQAHWEEHFPSLRWEEIFQVITTMPVTDDYLLEWKMPDETKISSLAINEWEFSEERVKSRLVALRAVQPGTQKGLSSFF